MSLIALVKRNQCPPGSGSESPPVSDVSGLCTSPASKLQAQCGEFIRGTCLSLKRLRLTGPCDNDEQTCEASGEESGGHTQQTLVKLGGTVNS